MRQFSSRGFITLVMVAYCILAAIFFVQYYCWNNIFHLTLALPTLFATTLVAMRRRHGGWFIPLAFGFSTLGDYAGAIDNFLVQISMFAVAHIFFIADFWPYRSNTKGRAIAVGVLVCIVLACLCYIVPMVAIPSFRYAILIYAILITLMCSTAIRQTREHRGWYIVAALLFVFSDSVIAYSMVSNCKDATLLIMPTYYAAQAIFTVLYMLRKRA